MVDKKCEFFYNKKEKICLFIRYQFLGDDIDADLEDVFYGITDS